jgi:hexosaminidase
MDRKSLLLFASILLASPAWALWPLPRNIQTGTSALRLSGDFNIKLFDGAPSDLHDAASRTISFLKNDKLQRLVVGRGAADANTIKNAKSLSSLTISLDASHTGKVRSISQEAIDSVEIRQEGYILSVPGDGSGATLTSNSTLGLYRGMTTFGQLWYEWDGATYTLDAPVQIEDSPVYVRGVSIVSLRLSDHLYTALSGIYAGYGQEFVRLVLMNGFRGFDPCATLVSPFQISNARLMP